MTELSRPASLNAGGDIILSIEGIQISPDIVEQFRGKAENIKNGAE